MKKVHRLFRGGSGPTWGRWVMIQPSISLVYLQSSQCLGVQTRDMLSARQKKLIFADMSAKRGRSTLSANVGDRVGIFTTPLTKESVRKQRKIPYSFIKSLLTSGRCGSEPPRFANISAKKYVLALFIEKAWWGKKASCLILTLTIRIKEDE